MCAVDQKKSFFPRAVPFLDLLPFQGPFPLTGALTGRPVSYEKTPYEFRKAYGKLQKGTLPELGGNFRLCAVDQKRSFFPRAVPFLDLLPFQGPFPLTGALTGRPPYGKAPYGEASYEKAPYELQESLREATGRDFTKIGREFPLVCRRPKKGRFFLGLCCFWTFCPFRDLSLLQGPLRANRLTGRPLTGRLLTRRPLTNYRKAYGKLRGGTLPELGGNFRLCAVDQNRSFFPRVYRFGTFCPLRDLSPVQGPLRADRLTGRFLTGRLPTGRPLTGRLLTGDTFNYRKADGKLRGGSLPAWAGISACVP